ncbi:HemD Uroporphyrinogen-III synthase [Rhabdaerophilaceae bacterium]
MAPPRLLIVRAEPECSETARLVEQYGGEPIRACVRVEQEIIAQAPSVQPDLFVATSARALRLGAEIAANWLDLPIAVVGAATADAAKVLGFRDIRIGDGAVDGLFGLLGQGDQRLVYLAGEPRRPELESWAAAHSRSLSLWMRYRMRDCDSLAPTVSDAMRSKLCDVILHFSRESAFTLDRLAREAGVASELYQLQHVCLSEPIAECVKSLAARQSKVIFPLVSTQKRAEILVKEAISNVQRKS